MPRSSLPPGGPPGIAPADSIRGEYERHGAPDYYRRFGHAYRNPHEPIIVRSLRTLVPEWRLDLTHVLDLAAGSGEVTLALRSLGAKSIEATDPFTQAAYAERTGAAAEPFSFEAIAAGALAGRSFSLIVCSFALHLCPPSRLPKTLLALSAVAPTLLVLTPHKRPEIKSAWGWALAEDRVIERVRSRLYRSHPAAQGVVHHARP